jgi:hypothetical protein
MQLPLELKTGPFILRLLVLGFVQTSGQLVALGHQSISRFVHLLADPSDLAISFFLSSVTSPHSPNDLGLQMLD